MVSHIKNDLIATKIALSMMWHDKKFFLFALFLTIYIALMIGGTILLMIILIPLLKPWIEYIGTKSELLKATLWLMRYLLIGPGIILTVIALEFMPVAIAYYTFQDFSQKPCSVWQALVHTFSKIKQHGAFAPFHQKSSIYFFAPLMALENLNWNMPVTKMYELWDKTIFAKSWFSWWGRMLLTILLGIIMFKIFRASATQANYLRNYGIDVVSLVFLAVTALELFFVFTLWITRIIFKTALYAYSQEQPTGPFPNPLIKKFFLQAIKGVGQSY